MNKKLAIILAILIGGILLVSWGFNRIADEQRTQNSVISLKESQKAACHAANVLRAQSNVNGYAEYKAWVAYAHSVTVPPISAAVHKALVPVLEQTWIPLTNCTIPPHHADEGYPIPSAVKFSAQPPPHSALTVPPEDP